MPTIFEQGVKAGQAMLNAVAGETVEYRRGKTSVVLTAIYSDKGYGADVEHDAVQSYQSDDFLIMAADILIGGKVTAPQRGDQIVRTIDGRVETYLVTNPPGRNVYERSGPAGRYRVHTKLDSKAPAP